MRTSLPESSASDANQPMVDAHDSAANASSPMNAASATNANQRSPLKTTGTASSTNERQLRRRGSQAGNNNAPATSSSSPLRTPRKRARVSNEPDAITSQMQQLSTETASASATSGTNAPSASATSKRAYNKQKKKGKRHRRGKKRTASAASSAASITEEPAASPTAVSLAPPDASTTTTAAIVKKRRGRRAKGLRHMHLESDYDDDEDSGSGSKTHYSRSRGDVRGRSRPIDFNDLTLASLRKYRRVHRLRLKPTSSKMELVAAVSEHFASMVQTIEQSMENSSSTSTTASGGNANSLTTIVSDLQAMTERQSIDSFVLTVRTGVSVLHPQRRRRSSKKNATMGERPLPLDALQRQKQLLVQRVKTMIHDLDLSALVPAVNNATAVSEDVHKDEEGQVKSQPDKSPISEPSATATAVEAQPNA